MKETLKKFREIVKNKKKIESTLALIQWDMETTVPKGGQSLIAEIIGDLSLKSYEISTSKELIELLDVLNENKNSLTELERIEVECLREENEKLKKIPAEEYREFSELTVKAQGIWVEAREKNDFNIFKGTLEKIFEYSKKFAKYRNVNEKPYNVFLDDYEKGMTIEKLDNFFLNLKSEIVPLLQKIKEKKVNFIPKNKVSIENQKKLSKYIAEYIGFDFERGVISESAHPFTLTVSPDDVRLTSRYFEDMPFSSVFSAIHEGGHGIYEQGIGSELKETVLAEGTSTSIHESQSRFYENMIGRSKEFWFGICPVANKYYEFIKKENLDELYKEINIVTPSLIRVEADELTYSLHIMVRYEIEKGLFNGEYTVENLPKIWNEKMKEYLGVEPVNDSEGVLQDVHWSCGLIGYFPSYALGNAYSAQIYMAMRKDLDIEQLLLNGKISKITEWLHNKIHKYGKSKTPQELIKQISGEDLNSKYYIDYLKEKYSKIYEL